MNITDRSIQSASWNVIASGVTVSILFVRSIVLARMLPVDTFGIYAGARALVGLTAVLASFGLGAALIHRAPETEDEEQAASVHFTLTLIFSTIWAGFLILVALAFMSGQSRIAMLILVLTTFGLLLVATPKMMLTRRVAHRRLAAIQTVTALLTTAVAIILASFRITLWALLATDIVTFFVTFIGLYVWRPVWRPRLSWSPNVIRYYLDFGSKNLASVGLLNALDRLDDLWTRYVLGPTAMGYYSRAYSFATYPRAVLATPVNSVAAGTYAELKGDRILQSKAFVQVNSFLIRSGFFLAGLLVLVAPEFISLGLGEKWLPMLNVFRLMLVFTLLDPIKQTISSVFVANGRPDGVMKVRFIQLVVLIVGLVLLGSTMGIIGVALAVNAMLIVGIAVLLWKVKDFVDFSLRELFVAPSLALLIGLLLSYVCSSLPGIQGNDWHSVVIKIIVFVSIYGFLLYILERDQISEIASMLYLQFLKPLRQKS